MENEIQNLRKSESEKYVIVALIQNPDWIDRAMEILDRPDRMLTGLHADIYRAMIERYKEGKSRDLIGLSDHSNRYTAGDISGLMTDVLNKVVLFRPDDFQSHLTEVAHAYIRTQLALGVESADIEELKTYMGQLEKRGRTKLLTSDDLTMEVFGDLYNQDAKYHYPFTLIDTATNGIAKGQVIIVAGRPSAGKSTFVQNVAVDISKQHRVLFATNEMSAEQIGRRILTQLAKVNMFDDIFRNPEQDDIIANGLEVMGQLKLDIFELQNVGQLELMLKENPGKYDVVIVDYLQLMEPKIRQKDMYNRATQTINELTHLAKDYNLPFIIACQYNRQADKLQPTMADLRESGQIEQNADVIISLWNDDDTRNNIPLINVDILKNRNGSTFLNNDKVKFRLRYDRKLFTFDNSLGGGNYGNQKTTKPYKD